MVRRPKNDIRALSIAGLLLGLAAIPACSGSDSTKIVVAVWSDLSVPTDLDAIRLDVVGGTGGISRLLPLAKAKVDKPVVETDITPSDVGRKDGVFTVTATGLLGRTEVVRQSARVSFVAGEARLLSLFLGANCRWRNCPDGSTCAAGVCEPLQVVPLPPFTPANLQPPDAGRAGALDAQQPDVAVPVDGATTNSIDANGEAGGMGGAPGWDGHAGTGGSGADGGRSTDVPDAPAGTGGVGGTATGGAGGAVDAGADVPLTGVGGAPGHGGARTGGAFGSGGVRASGGATGAGGSAIDAAAGGNIGGAGGSATGGAVGFGGTLASGGAAGSGGVDAGTGGACTPACASDQDCVGNVCVDWFGQACTSSTECPSGSTCCGGNRSSCLWTRVPPGDGANPGEFVLSNDDATVTDSITGLTWERNTNIAHAGCSGHQRLACTWDQARAYCHDLDLGGYSDWRLPSYFELLTIVDFTRAAPALDSTTFATVPAWCSWTGTAGLQANTIRVVDFLAGDVGENENTGNCAVRCVR